MEQGNEIKYLATINSKSPSSLMYHTPNIGLTLMQSRCLNVQLVSKLSSGEKEKEVKDLEVLLNNLDADGVVCGTIASSQQKEIVENACESLRLKVLTPLWGLNQEQLLKEILSSGFEMIIISVASEGFNESWLGRKIDEKCIEELVELSKKRGISVTGENGEYETLVLDCPLFNRRLEITKSENLWKDNVGALEIKDAKFVNK